MKLALTNEQIARVLIVPEKNVIEYWPIIEQCLDALTLASDLSKISALATIAVETNYTFAPIKELDNHDHTYLKSKPYYPYYGRGFGQTTWKEAYEKYGKLLGVNLVDNPDAACDSNVSASIFAAMWRDKHCDLYSDTMQFTVVRRKWNGGVNGLHEYLHLVNELIDANQEAKRVQAQTTEARGS